SSEPTDSEVWLPSSLPNSSITCCTCSRVTSLRVAMAMPIFCTSLGSMCLSTSAASCSPSDSSRTAARWTPVSWTSSIVGHPTLPHLCHALGIGLHRFTRHPQTLLIGIHRQCQLRRRAQLQLVRRQRRHAVCSVHYLHFGGQRVHAGSGQGPRRAGNLPQCRAQHTEQQRQHHDGPQQQAQSVTD